MALGVKRTCGSCGAKFYDLEKTPIICPKCSTTLDLEALSKPKRGRKKGAEKEEVEDVEIDLGGLGEIEALEEIEEDDAAVIAALDDGIRDEMEVEDGEIIPDSDSDKMLVDLEDDTDILEGGDEEASDQK